MELGNSKPKVSICIPAYCQIDFLRLTLESVCIQNFKDYEIVITDDSPDNSVFDLVLEFDFGHRLKYFKNPAPLGSPKNWNQSVAKASGYLIKVLHHDDRFLDSDALGSFVRLMDDNPEADFGFCASKILDVNTNRCRIHRPHAEHLQMLRSNPELLFLGNFIGAPSATIYKSSLIHIHYDYRLKWLVDIDFYIRLLQKNNIFAYTNETLILTPTNANHQVTELCKNNAELEIWEYSALYLKHHTKLLPHISALNQLYGLFGRYGIYSVDKIPNFSNFEQDQKKLLKDVLDKFQKKPILKLIYFLYWQLKVPPFFRHLIQTNIHILFHVFCLVRRFVKRVQKFRIRVIQ